MDQFGFGSRENMELAEWLESVLKKYCQDLAERQSIPPPPRKTSKVRFKKTKAKKKESNSVFQLESVSESEGGNTTDSSFRSSASEEDDGIKLGESANPNDNAIFLLITGIKFEKIKQDAGDTLRVDIDYYVGDTAVRRKEHFIINVSRKYEKKNEPSMEKLLETGRREIDVYTKLFPKLEGVIDFNLVNLRLSVPTCFFGQYETEEVDSQGNTAKKELSDAFGFDISTSAKSDLIFNENRSILITHDLEKMNFVKKKSDEKMTVAETRAVLREIAQIHATSWVLQMKNLRTPLFETFPFLLHPRRAVPVCVTLSEQGMDPFAKLLASRLRRDADGPELVGRIVSYHAKLTETFFKLMQPPEAPSPSTLIHLDLQLANIYFRYNKPDKVEKQSYTSDILHEVECRISNWKIASFGSPMHDVAFLLLSSVAPETRREHTTDLIQYYYQMFDETAKKLKFPVPFKFEDLMKEYNRSLLFALLLVIGNIDEDEDQPLDKASLDSYIEALRYLVKSGTI